MKQSTGFLLIALLSVSILLSISIWIDSNIKIEEEKERSAEIKRLSLVDYTSAFVIETNEILIIDRKTNEVKFVLTDTLAIQILTAKEYQLQVMEYEKIIFE